MSEAYFVCVRRIDCACKKAWTVNCNSILCPKHGEYICVPGQTSARCTAVSKAALSASTVLLELC